MISLPNKVKGPALGEGGGESFTPSCTRACAPQAWLINYALSELLIQAVFKVYFATGVLAPRNLQFRGPIVGFVIRKNLKVEFRFLGICNSEALS